MPEDTNEVETTEQDFDTFEQFLESEEGKKLAPLYEKHNEKLLNTVKATRTERDEALKKLKGQKPEPEEEVIAPPADEIPEWMKPVLNKVDTLEKTIKQDRDMKAKTAKQEKIKATAEKLGFEHPEDVHLYVGTAMDEGDIEARLKLELEAKPYLRKKLPDTGSTNPGIRRPEQSDDDFLKEFLDN